MTDAIKDFIVNETEDLDFVLCEIGGTVGDIEGLPFFLKRSGNSATNFLAKARCLFISRSCPMWRAQGTQNEANRNTPSKSCVPSVFNRMWLLCRCDREIPAEERRKIALFCNVRPEAVIQALDVGSIYDVPSSYHDEGFDDQVPRPPSVCRMFRRRSDQMARN